MIDSTEPVSRATRRAVFLDRDGTIIEEVGYLDRTERVEFYPWTIDAIRAFNRAGLAVVMISNQSGVARGFFTETVVDHVHTHMAAMLAEGWRPHRRVLLLSAPPRRQGGGVCAALRLPETGPRARRSSGARA